MKHLGPCCVAVLLLATLGGCPSGDVLQQAFNGDTSVPTGPPAAPDRLADVETVDGGGAQQEPAPTYTGPTVTLSAQELAGSGGSLLYMGQTYAGDLTVAENELVIVNSTDGNQYLYNPILGDAPLSKETNEKSLFWFVYGLQNGHDEVAKLLHGRKVGVSTDEVILSTKVSAFRKDESSLRLRNLLNRFVAVSFRDQFEVYYMMPQNQRFDSNWLRLATRSLTDVYLPDAFAGTQIDLTVRDGSVVETFAATYNFFGPDIQDYDAWNRDADLMERLNNQQQAYIIAELVKHAIGLFPAEAGDAVAGLVANIYRVVTSETIDVEIEAIITLIEDFVYSAGTGVAEGVGTVAGGWGGALVVIFNTASDIAAAYGFWNEELERVNRHWVGATGYDTVEIEAKKGLWPATYTGDVFVEVAGESFRVQGKMTFEANADGTGATTLEIPVPSNERLSVTGSNVILGRGEFLTFVSRGACTTPFNDAGSFTIKGAVYSDRTITGNYAYATVHGEGSWENPIQSDDRELRGWQPLSVSFHLSRTDASR